MGHVSIMWSSAVGRRKWGVAISMEFCGGFGRLFLDYFVICGFDARCYVKLAFIFNLLLLLFIPICIKVKL